MLGPFAVCVASVDIGQLPQSLITVSNHTHHRLPTKKGGERRKTWCETFVEFASKRSQHLLLLLLPLSLLASVTGVPNAHAAECLVASDRIIFRFTLRSKLFLSKSQCVMKSALSSPLSSSSLGTMYFVRIQKTRALSGKARILCSCNTQATPPCWPFASQTNGICAAPGDRLMSLC